MFKNKTSLQFTDISSEEYRVYEFKSFLFFKRFVKLDKPLKLAVSASGGHRVYTADGLSHYIPSGWIHLYWKAKKGKPNFVA